jgi:DNA-binding response OmpR family regulator
MGPDNATRSNQQRVRLLLVEDEPILAFALEEFLIDAGFEIVGVAGRLQTALAIIDSGVFDAVILDANLAGVSAAPAAMALTARGVPFIVISGYSSDQQPRAFSGALRFQKPCQPADLVRALQGILPATGADRFKLKRESDTSLTK